MNKKTSSTLKEYIAMPWHFAVKVDENLGQTGFLAWVTEVPECSGFAKSQLEALLRATESLEEFLANAVQRNELVDLPASTEFDIEETSGLISLRVPKSLHIGLKRAAARENISLNQYAAYALTMSLCRSSTRGLPLIRNYKNDWLHENGASLE